MVTNIELLSTYQLQWCKYRVIEHLSDTWLPISSYWTHSRYIVINIDLLNTDQIHCYKYRATEH